MKKALNRHKIMPARDADGWFEFDEDQDCRGFNGILVEAKSGITQDFRDAVPQLRIYRSALNPSEKQRLLVWGIVEKEELEEDAVDAQKALAAENKENQNDDLWVFSSAKNIPNVLRALDMSQAEEAQELNEG